MSFLENSLVITFEKRSQDKSCDDSKIATSFWVIVNNFPDIEDALLTILERYRPELKRRVQSILEEMAFFTLTNNTQAYSDFVKWTGETLIIDNGGENIDCFLTSLKIRPRKVVAITAKRISDYEGNYKSLHPNYIATIDSHESVAKKVVEYLTNIVFREELVLL